jgi:SepF-like predicted cell division protein (DUF552 family)
MTKYVIIEQAEDTEAYITHIEAKDENEVSEIYESVGNGNFILLNEEAFYNMCQAGCGA